MRKANQKRRRGYSLIELVVALAGSSLLIAGLSSTIYIALKTADTSNAPTTSVIDGNSALTDLLTDVEFALTITELGSNAITFTAPDRDANASPETIRYAWSGTGGEPLTRQYNGGEVQTVADNVHAFTVEYVLDGTKVAYIKVRLQVTDNAQSSIETAIPLLNRP